MIEPGTCDTFTTAEPSMSDRIVLNPPNPPPPLAPEKYERPYSNFFTEERTQSGWIIRLTEVSIHGPQRYRTDVIHPWLGVLGTFFWNR